MSEAEARVALVRAKRAMAQLQRELSGCDWCCGGGDEMMSRLRADEAKALAILSAAGVTPPTPCVECSYYDALEGSDYCERCKGSTQDGWPSKCIRCNAVLDTDEGAQTGVCPDCWTWEDGEVGG